MENLEIAGVLSQMANLLEIQDANPFRVRAYRNAARFVDGYATPMRKLVEAIATFAKDARLFHARSLSVPAYRISSVNKRLLEVEKVLHTGLTALSPVDDRAYTRINRCGHHARIPAD